MVTVPDEQYRYTQWTKEAFNKYIEERENSNQRWLTVKGDVRSKVICDQRWFVMATLRGQCHEWNPWHYSIAFLFYSSIRHKSGNGHHGINGASEYHLKVQDKEENKKEAAHQFVWMKANINVSDPADIHRQFHLRKVRNVYIRIGPIHSSNRVASFLFSSHGSLKSLCQVESFQRAALFQSYKRYMTRSKDPSYWSTVLIAVIPSQQSTEKGNRKDVPNKMWLSRLNTCCAKEYKVSSFRSLLATITRFLNQSFFVLKEWTILSRSHQNP